MLSHNHRADREVSRRYRRASRRRMVNKPEGIGNVDGAHDEGVGDSADLRHAFVAEDISTCT